VGQRFAELLFVLKRVPEPAFTSNKQGFQGVVGFGSSERVHAVGVSERKSSRNFIFNSFPHEFQERRSPPAQA
jgi:hypothetical protein